ncbi:MAG TPA: GNAT family N-acetyltransferase [Thermoleophilaceae bacterium]
MRKAERSELPQVAALLARAFYDDPAMSWTFPSDRKRLAQAERFWSIRLRYMASQEEIYVTEDLSATAVWGLPDRWHVSWRETGELARMMVNPRLPMLFTGLRRLEKAHPPKPPSFYLAVLGTDPPKQGQGLGSALMEPVLEHCDRDGVPAYLESSKERNLDFYARFGFRVLQTVRLPGGPDMWPMWREPAGAAH